MNRLPIVLAAAGLVAGCVSTPPSEADFAAAETKARGAADQLFIRLSGELSAAMSAGGPPVAIAVCRDRAPAIAAQLEAETGVNIERTSLRIRSPANVPDPWERSVLEDFERRHAAGEAWTSLEARRVRRAELRWMRPIPTGALCVSCHGGAEVAPETAKAIAASYPNDAARGYAVGELRGAFTARVPLR